MGAADYSQCAKMAPISAAAASAREANGPVTCLNAQPSADMPVRSQPRRPRRTENREGHDHDDGRLSSPPPTSIAPSRRRILADGYDFVFDYEKSHGAWVHDSRTGREYLDFLTFFGSNPIGYNHPRMKDPEFRRMLARVAQLKPSLSDLYSVEYAWFVDTFERLAMPRATASTRSSSRAAPSAVENALKVAFDWKVRRNSAKGIPGEKGGAGDPLPRGLPRPQRLHAVAHQHRSRARPTSSPSSRGRASRTPSCASRSPREVERDVRAAEERALEQMRKRVRRPPRRHRGHHHRAHPGRGRGQPLPPGVPAGPAAHGARARVPLPGGRGPDRHRPHRPHVGARALRPQARRPGVRQEDAGRAAAWPAPASTRSRRTSSRSPPASTPRGAAASPTWCASAAILEIIDEERLVENARVVGEHLLRGLDALQAELGGVMTNARGRGLMIAFDLRDAGGPRQGARRADRERAAAADLRHAVHPLPSAAEPDRRRGGRRARDRAQGPPADLAVASEGGRDDRARSRHQDLQRDPGHDPGGQDGQGPPGARGVRGLLRGDARRRPASSTPASCPSSPRSCSPRSPRRRSPRSRSSAERAPDEQRVAAALAAGRVKA